MIGEGKTTLSQRRRAVHLVNEDGEDAEADYAELVEYLRVAVINIFMDSRNRDSQSKESSGNGRPLH